MLTKNDQKFSFITEKCECLTLLTKEHSSLIYLVHVSHPYNYEKKQSLIHSAIKSFQNIVAFPYCVVNDLLPHPTT